MLRLIRVSQQATAPTRDSVLKAFKSLSFDIAADDIIEKCQQICEMHNLSSIDLAYKWEEHIDKVNDDATCYMHALTKSLLWASTVARS